MGGAPDAVLAQLAAFEQQLAAHVRWIVDCASAAPPGGSHGWDRVLFHYGVVPDPPLTRLGELRSRAQTHGATITEVRRAIAAMTQRAAMELEVVASGAFAAAPEAFGSSALDQRLAVMRAHLSRLVDQVGSDYAARMCTAQAAAAAGVASIFANAVETAQQAPWAGQKIDATRVLACPGCGAPQEVELNFSCRYCGSSMVQPSSTTGGSGGDDV